MGCTDSFPSSNQPVSPGELLAGPRGRRFLFEFALQSPQSENLWTALALAARELGADHSGGDAVVVGGEEVLVSRSYMSVLSDGISEVAEPVWHATPTDVANELDALALPQVTESLLRNAVARSVDAARYWQEPDPEDELLAAPEVCVSLRRIADHVCASTLVSWWNAPLAIADQWAVGWAGGSFPEPGCCADSLAIFHREASVATELDRGDLEFSPAMSGEWWSIPLNVPASSRPCGDGSPCGLWWVEDSFGEEAAAARRVAVPSDSPIYEVNCAEAWARLCAEFPLDVTASRRYDWYRVTGRDGAWALPDWQAVAREYAGVHLTVGAYLSSATTAIPVVVGGEPAASVIAGWNPDWTIWLSPRVRYSTETVEWERRDSETSSEWHAH